MSRSLGESLSDPRELDRSGVVHTELPGAVLAADLANRRFDPDVRQSLDNERSDLRETSTDAAHRIRVGNGPGQRDDVLMEHGGATSGQPDHRSEPELAGKIGRPVEPRSISVLFAERNHTAGCGDSERLGVGPVGDAAEQSVGDPGIKALGVVVALADHGDRVFGHRAIVERCTSILAERWHTWGVSKTRVALIVLVFAVIAAACGESGPLERAGEASSGWVTAVTTPTTTNPPVVIEIGNEGLVGAGDVLWANDDIGPVTPSSDPHAAIAAVWDRQLGSRFVQASRAEIAAALPTIRFPEAVPEDVRWMTSQLVFDPISGLLDVDTSAAFGLWTVEPYTVENGRLGVLRVGTAPSGIGAAKSDIVPIIVPDGLSLGWTEAGLRYELFCRATIPELVCTAIVDSFVPLSGLLST